MSSKTIYNSLIAFLGGVSSCSILYILFSLGKFLRFEIILPLIYGYLLIALFYGCIEEGTKFLLIKKWKVGIFPYGFLLGFGFGMTENLYRYSTWRVFGYEPVLLHILTAGIICYFVKKNKSILGLLIAIIIHTFYDFLIFSNF